jgi:TonB family protein
MKRITFVALLLSFCAAAAVAQDAKPSPTPAAEEKVYKEDEVDVKAKMKRDEKPSVRIVTNGGPPPFTPDCPARGQATLRLVVDRAGKVAAVTVVKESGCAVFDKRMVKQAWKLKFTPALKDGQLVSQEADIPTSYEWPKGRK